ncbi:hypothetical protein [Bacteroides acidifaciens]|uniref:hypothetical protein n=1 Tax=Bacteroides acidifaciens TaxID=85831 RepID=UPI003F6934B3
MSIKKSLLSAISSLKINRVRWKDVGTIILRGGIELDAITVTAQKKLVKTKLTVPRYDVQGDTDAKIVQS